MSAQENGTKFQEKIVSCVELSCRHQAIETQKISLLLLLFSHLFRFQIWIENKIRYVTQILICRYKSDAGELQFLHPVIAKIIGDS